MTRAVRSVFSPRIGRSRALKASVVGLQRVVRMGLRVMEGRREQLLEEAGIDPVPVGARSVDCTASSGRYWMTPNQDQMEARAVPDLAPFDLGRGLPVPGLVATGEHAAAGRPLVGQPHLPGGGGQAGCGVGRGPSVVAPSTWTAREVLVRLGRLLHQHESGLGSG